MRRDCDRGEMQDRVHLGLKLRRRPVERLTTFIAVFKVYKLSTKEDTYLRVVQVYTSMRLCEVLNVHVWVFSDWLR